MNESEVPELNNLWRGKRVLVTGADGFIGSHLVEALLAQGAAVTGCVRWTSTRAHGSPRGESAFQRLPATSISQLQDILLCDLSSAESIAEIARRKPEVIFHLGASAWVPYSFIQPIEVDRINVQGTLHVLEAARRLPRLERVVCTSSSEIYGPAQTSKIDEVHPLCPTSPYGASKVAADRYAYSYHVTYGLPVSIIRPFNTYGPRHVYDVIPKFISLALTNKPLLIHGDGRQERDFMYVQDAVRAFLLMGSHPNSIGRCVNFGTGSSIAIVTLADEIIRQAGSRSKLSFDDERAAEVSKLCCNPALATKLFGWRAEISLDEGLRRNIEWARTQ